METVAQLLAVSASVDAYIVSIYLYIVSISVSPSLSSVFQDRFYLSAVEKRWHASCLQCYACRQPLERESSCYSRDGNIYCKNDYYR